MAGKGNIDKMGNEELFELLKNAINAWERLNPNDELILISLPKKDLQERKRIVDYICRAL